MKNSPFRVLFREFLFRTVDLELLSPNSDMSKLFGQIAALLIFLSLGFSVPALAVGSISNMPPQIVTMLTFSGEHFLIATTMLVTGLLAVLSWDSTFPNKRDVFVLGPLPVRMSTLFLAKVSAVAVALSLTVVSLHLLAGVAWPLALYSQAVKAPTPVLTYEPALPPVAVDELKPVLDRDLARALISGGGAIAPDTGAGVSIGVVRHGARRVLAYGVANPNSIFEIGSITKTFTGLLLAKMAVRGEAALDEPVRALLPKAVVSERPGLGIRLLDLATHRSGLPRMPDNFSPADSSNPYADYDAAHLYAYVAKHGLIRPANAPFDYSNLGFALLGVALANRAGMSYPELLKREILDPLGMTDTAIMITADQRPRFIQGYDFRQHAAHEWDLDAFAGAGGIRSTADDMLAYLEAQLHPEKLLDADALPRAITESHLIRERVISGQRIALAWLWDDKNRVYWHNGGTGGFSSHAFFDPKRDYAAVVLLNQSPGLAGFADLLGEHVRERLAGEPVVSLDRVVTPVHTGLGGAPRLLAVYWIVMFAAGSFIYCCVLALQGLLAELLPRRWFLRVSGFLQLGAFTMLVAGYIMLPIAVTPVTILEAQNRGWLFWSPTYWFLGLLQQLNGSPALAPLAWRAWLGIAVVLALTVVSYVLSYLRTLRRIVEEPDLAPRRSRFRVLPRFGRPLSTAIVQFSIGTLMRSRQHRLILAFYWGIALAFGILGAKTPEALVQAQIPLVITSILVLCSVIVGMRIVTSMPFELPANWVFKVTPVPGGDRALTAVRIAVYLLGPAPVWCGSAALFFSLWPWREAAGHLAVLGLLGVTLTEVCLAGSHKIPFTCSYLPGKSRMNIAVLGYLMLMLILIVKAAQLEYDALSDPTRFRIMIGALAAIAGAAWWRTSRLAWAEEAGLKFEEHETPAITALDLHRDGTPLL